jgi:hypothetical protein
MNPAMEAQKKQVPPRVESGRLGLEGGQLRDTLKGWKGAISSSPQWSFGLVQWSPMVHFTSCTAALLQWPSGPGQTGELPRLLGSFH